MEDYCIGIDLGGTFIKMALLDAELNSVAEDEIPTPAQHGPDGVLDAMTKAADRLIANAGIDRRRVAGVGIGSPGPLDLETGAGVGLPNIPGFENVCIRNRMAEALGLPVVLENDANAAAFGEFLLGSGRDVSMIVLLTLGTGVGGGIVQEGRVYHGAHGAASELGHMIVEPAGELCGCGQHGCLEQYASATALARHACRLIERGGADGPLRHAYEANGHLTSKDVDDARRGGDGLALEAWTRMVRYLAIGCLNVLRVFDPDLIVLGGGLAKAGDGLLTPLRQEVARRQWHMTEPKTEIVAATLGNRAGLAGAAALAFEAFGPKAGRKNP